VSEIVWLSGALRQVLEGPRRSDLGVMLTPDSTGGPQLLAAFEKGCPVAMDNGVYGGKFQSVKWQAYLTAVPAEHRGRCLFAVVPDVLHREQLEDGTVRVFGDAVATRALFDTYEPIVRGLGYRVAFVSQDGCTNALVPWDRIHVLFIGGSNDWKYCAASVELIREAQRRGVAVHVGRAQPSWAKVQQLKRLGVQSFDGTYLRFRPFAMPEVLRNLGAMNSQPMLLAQRVAV
jgi:hypothetical protein